MLAPVPRSGLWLLLGAFALLGLFAMHGLGGHGTQHGSQHEPPSGGQHQHAASPAGPAEVHDQPECSPGECAGELMLMLCLAVLTVGLAAAVFVAGRPSIVAAAGELAAVATLARSARERDPPCLFHLSVQRC